MKSKFRQYTRIGSPGFLDFDVPEQLFAALERTFQCYLTSPVKVIEEALFLVLGLAHLREWIAPGFKGKRKPRIPAERFSEALYSLESYRILLDVANHAKHQNTNHDLTITSTHYDNIDEWPDFDSANSMDAGPVAEYWIGKRKLADIFEETLRFYRDHWFSLSIDDQMGTVEERMENVLAKK